MTVTTPRTSLAGVKKSLLLAGFTPEKSELVFVPKNYIEVTDFNIALQIYIFLETCHDDEDIECVWNNAEILDELWKQVEEKVESSRFRT